MKKVALLIYSSPFHFPPTINAANILSDRGFEVHLLGIDHTDDWSQQLNKNVKLIYLDKPQTGIKGVLRYFKTMWFVRRYLKQHNIDRILGYDAKSVLPAFFATRFSSSKWFFHQHDFWDKPKSLWEKFLWQSERKLLKYADVTSFPQLERAEFFTRTAALNKKPYIVYNGPRKHWIESKSEADKIIASMRSRFDYLLIYQGGWSKFFGLERIFDALALCKTNTGLIMLGEERETGLREAYVEYISRLNLQNRVYLADKYISYEALTGFTRYCDAAIAILTADTDAAPFNNRFLIGASNKISEYIACGLPVLLQDAAPNRRFLEKYHIGLLIDSNDPEQFAAAIDDLMMDNDKRIFFRQNNRRIFNEELNFDNQFKKIADQL